MGLRLPLHRRLHRYGSQQHRAQLVSVRRLPHRVPRSGLQLAQPVGSALADRRHPDLRLRGHGGAQLALRPPGGPGRDSHGLRALHAARTGEGGQREQPHPEGLGHGPALPAGEGAPRPAGIGHDAAAAHPVALLRVGRRGHSRLRRHRFGPVRQPVLFRQVPSRHRRSQRGLRHHRPGGLPGPSSGLRHRRPLLSPRPAAPAGHRRLLHLGLRGPLRLVPLRAQAVDGGDPSDAGQCRRLPAGHLHLHDAGRHRTTGDADHLFRHVRRLLARVRWLRRLGHRRRHLRRHRWPARDRRVAHDRRPRLPRRRISADPRLAQCQARYHPRHRGCDRALHRGQATPGGRGDPGPPGAQPGLLLRHQSGPLRRQSRGGTRRDGRPARDQRRREVHPPARRVGAVASPPWAWSGSSG